MSKYILGALATLLAIKGKDGVAKLIDPPPGVSKASDWTDPQPPAPKAPAPVHQRVESQSVESSGKTISKRLGGQAVEIARTKSGSVRLLTPTIEPSSASLSS